MVVTVKMGVLEILFENVQDSVEFTLLLTLLFPKVLEQVKEIEAEMMKKLEQVKKESKGMFR